MSTKIVKLYITLAIVFFLLSRVTSASFEITEIMYDLDGTDTNREWIEVKNSGTESADLSKWFFFSDNSKHALVPQSESLVPAGGYAVITQNVTNFRGDWSNFSGLLFDSSWTGFNNEGETIALKDPDLNMVSEVSFTSSQGGAGDGNSLQKISSSWSGATPTPGSVNQGGSGGGEDGGESSSGNTTAGSLTPVVKKKEVEVPKIVTNIISPNTVFAGIPFTITMKTEGYGKEPLKMGRFVWNFGDGELKAEYEHMPFEHIYEYPGDYVITLSYYRVYAGTVVDATDRLTIKVLPSEVSISSVGKSDDPYVEIENKSKFEVDISMWTILGSVHSFTIPQGTIILPSQKLKFSSKITNFTTTDITSITLKSKIGDTAASYPTTINRSKTSHQGGSSIKQNTNPTTPSVINLNDLGATASKASGLELSNNILPWIGLVGVILLGIITVLLIQRRQPRDYIEKEIRAEDMTIIE